MIDLAWTAPGDDGYDKQLSSGEYRLQYSTWSGVSWSTASANIVISTANISFGDPELHLLSGLEKGSTFVVRIWTADELYAWSGISNGATSWAQIDVIAPAAITTFSGFSPDFKKAFLSWNAPGDNGMIGDISTGTFRIEYSTWVNTGDIVWSTYTVKGMGRNSYMF